MPCQLFCRMMVTTLKDVIGANGSIEVVTVSEVSDDEITDIQTLTMQVKYAGNTASTFAETGFSALLSYAHLPGSTDRLYAVRCLCGQSADCLLENQA